MIAGAVALREGYRRVWKRTIFYRSLSRGLIIVLVEVAIAVDAPKCVWNLQKAKPL